MNTVADAMITVARLHDAGTTVGRARSLFADDHLHAVLIVQDGHLVAVVDRADLAGSPPDDAPVAPLGAVDGRVVSKDSRLEEVRQAMLESRRRRLAVIDADGTYRGLLCLKRSGTGFCSDADVLARRDAEQHGEPDTCGTAVRSHTTGHTE